MPLRLARRPGQKGTPEPPELKEAQRQGRPLTMVWKQLALLLGSMSALPYVRRLRGFRFHLVFADHDRTIAQSGVWRLQGGAA